MPLTVSRSVPLPVVTVQVREEVDVVAARQRARQLAFLIGFSHQDQVRIATAVSEVARNAFQYGGGGRVEFALALAADSQALLITVIDNGPGIPNLDAILGGRHVSTAGLGVGLAGSRRLMDGFEIDSTPGQGTTVRFLKNLAPEAPRLAPSSISKVVARLTQESISPTEEAQIQNRELLQTLASLHLRDAELEQRRAEMWRVNAELEETNRGVVALYAELEEKAAALRSADELKGHFLRHVSHEFRTPLNSILALSQLLLRRTDGALTTEQERQIGYIRHAAQDLTELVNDLLDLAKVESGKTDVRFSRIQLSQLFGSLRGVMRPLLTGDAVALVFEEPPEDFFFDSDESKIAQILRNLISNALKFTERGEVRISSEVAGGWLQVSVADTGIGIAPEHRERIFQEFAQIDNKIQGRVKGTGLGLPLSRKLATLLGGDLNMTSTPGQGSRFVLRIPVGARDASSATAGTEPDSILIIDDDEAARYIIRQRFRGTRYRVIEAPGGVEGAERARFEHPALILLDLVMPDRSGFDVLDDLKNDPATRGIPVVIHTSRRLRQSDFERLANRHAAILPKEEFWPPEIMEYIKKLLGESDLFEGERPSGP
jgi:signal transduction histidine kinase